MIKQKFKIKGLIYCIAVFLFLSVCTLYYINITLVILPEYSLSNPLSSYGNFNDYYIYKQSYQIIKSNPLDFSSFSFNVTGIAYFYYILTYFSPFSFETSVFIINIIFLAWLFKVYYSVCTYLRLKTVYYFLIFFITYFIYIVQLANKDIFYALALLIGFKYFLDKKYIKILLMFLILGFLIRAQLLILLLFLYLFLISGPSYKLKYTFIYIISSILGTLASHAVLGVESNLGMGVAKLLDHLNRHYYIGNLILNPIRFVQYIYSIVRASMSFARLVDILLIPLVILMPLILIGLWNILYNSIKYGFYKDKSVVYLYSVIMVLLVIPIVNLRYVVIIIPLLFLVIGMHNRVKYYV